MNTTNAIEHGLRYNDVDFTTACKSFATAWRRKHGRGVEVPAISHALSDLRGGEWWLSCAETGEVIGAVDHECRGVLIEDLPGGDTMLEDALRVDSRPLTPSVEETDAIILTHRYPARAKRVDTGRNASVKVTTRCKKTIIQPNDRGGQS